jgi:hypothetical protein
LLSDDQAFHLFDRQLMPNVFSKLVDQGVSLVGQLSSQLDGLVAPPDTPGTTIAGGPVGTVPAGNVTFSFFSQARTTKLQCALSGPGQDGRMQPCDSGVLTYPSLGPGQYTFTVQAIDARGRQDPTPAVRRFTVSA